METVRTQAARKYALLSCHQYQVFAGNEKYEESLLLTLTNNGGSICFRFTDLATDEVTSFDNPPTGEYSIPLKKGCKLQMEIIASEAIGAYKIIKKTKKD